MSAVEHLLSPLLSVVTGLSKGLGFVQPHRQEMVTLAVLKKRCSVKLKYVLRSDGFSVFGEKQLCVRVRAS